MDLGGLVKRLSENKGRAIAVGSSLLLSSLAAYQTVKYASESQTGKAVLTGACSLVLAGVAVYNSRRKDI